MADFTIKQMDTGPALIVFLTDETGADVDLTGAVIHFHMRNAVTGVQVVDAPVIIANQMTSRGLVTYLWNLGDTDVAGDYAGEFEAIFSDGTQITFPNDGNLWIRVEPRVLESPYFA